MHRYVAIILLVLLVPLVAAECKDGIDNDGDGFIDFGSTLRNDAGCKSAFDTNEGDDPQCYDLVDNDNDGLPDDFEEKYPGKTFSDKTDRGFFYIEEWANGLVMEER